jgi:hypothetical protein
VYRVFFIGKILLDGTGFCRNSHFPAGLVSREDVTSTNDMACWFINPNYNGENFFVRHT